MELETIYIYCLCDDHLKEQRYVDDPQSQMSTAEVMTTVLVASCYFSGNHERSREFLKEHNYIPEMLSKSQLNRRLHKIPEEIWRSLLGILAKKAHETNPTHTYLVDSFPVAVCQNIRIPRCRIYSEEKYRGWNASKKQYFYGLKVHMLLSQSGDIVEVFLSPGNYSDTSSLYDFAFDLPEGSYVHGDKAYNAYDVEDELKNEKNINLMPLRKKNSTRTYEFPLARGISYLRKKIESCFSVIEQSFPKHIHAVIPKGFELKTLLFLIAYGIRASKI